ncbi:hypothetical protein KSP40_PGU003893 [Platanthera guangdongensis]|uniref:Uncharacterized protein n=1 Tax=Platanthera guangdongensis TaxID=2320717 RepID=A0ABR2MZC1_9ASPA
MVNWISLAGPTMEWKPKSTNVNPSVSSKVCCTPFVDEGEARGAISFFSHTSDSTISDTSTKILNLEDMQISDSQQQVIIPDHLQVPESERTCLSFGSFGSNFGLDMGLKVEPEKTKFPEEPSKLSGELEEIVDQLPSYGRDETPVAQENIYSEDQQPEMPQNHLSNITDISSNIFTDADYDQSKEVATDRSQHSVIHAAPVFSNFGLMPQMVPQPFDPSPNYYASIYRPTADGDGCFSPFLLQGTAPKYNGSIAILPHHIDQSQQENGNSVVLSSAGPTIVSQTTVVQQTAAAVSQQTVPIFRQPAGVHISHYPPNYNPYNQYLSAFYVPSPAAIPYFLGNPTVFPQQPPTGSLYPPSTALTGTTSLKYPISQYKPATNSGPTGQGTYGMHPAGYSSALGSGNSNGSEDPSSSIFKENYVFFTPQQNGAPGVWISPPGRDISTLPAAGSFYNVPPHGHGHPVAFAPAQAPHGATYGGVYHPSQSVAAAPMHPLLQQSHAVMGGSSEMIGRPVPVYQHPQQCAPQINWADNF